MRPAARAPSPPARGQQLRRREGPGTKPPPVDLVSLCCPDLVNRRNPLRSSRLSVGGEESIPRPGVQVRDDDDVGGGRYLSSRSGQGRGRGRRQLLVSSPSSLCLDCGCIAGGLPIARLWIFSTVLSTHRWSTFFSSRCLNFLSTALYTGH